MKQPTIINQFEMNKDPVLPFDHKEAEKDDCGLPENPIYSNYVKYLWRRPGPKSISRVPSMTPEK